MSLYEKPSGTLKENEGEVKKMSVGKSEKERHLKKFKELVESAKEQNARDEAMNKKVEEEE